MRLSTSIQSLAVFIKKKYIGQEIKLLTYFNLLIMYKVVEESSEPYYLVTFKYDYGEDDATDVIRIKKEEFNENVQKVLRVLEKFTAIDDILTEEDFDNNKEALVEIFSEEELGILKLLLPSSFFNNYDEFIKSSGDPTVTREFFENYINFSKDWMLRGVFGNSWGEVLGLCRLVSVEVTYIDKSFEINWED